MFFLPVPCVVLDAGPVCLPSSCPMTAGIGSITCRTEVQITNALFICLINREHFYMFLVF